MNNSYNHRKGTKTVCITDTNGAPVKNAKVSVNQTKHKFLFGCSEFTTVPYVNGELSGEQKELTEKRLEKALDIFNFITLPFYWGGFEHEKGKPQTEKLLKTAKWLVSKGCIVKGHPLCWHTATAPWLLDMSNDEILKTQLQRIKRDVTDFAGVIDLWDAINEVVIMPIFDKYDNGITRICKELGRIKLVRKVFEEAKAANPNAVFLINDFETSEAYDILIEGLLESGVKLDAIGIQSHMHQGFWGEEKTAEILERYSRFNLPIHFTEINMVSGTIMPKHIVDLNDYKVEEWPTTPEGEERQAKDAATFYKMLFESPLVEAVTWWSLTDGGWLKAPAGFVTMDGRVKPIYEELHKLIKGEWFTKLNGVTDNDGNIEVTGFKGDYKAEFEGGSITFTID